MERDLCFVCRRDFDSKDLFKWYDETSTRADGTDDSVLAVKLVCARCHGRLMASKAEAIAGAKGTDAGKGTE